MRGFLYMIIGPMCAGKSSKLVRLVRNFKNKKVNIKVYKHSIDTRFDAIEEICSHDMVREPCISITNTKNIFDDPDYNLCEVIVIEEAQFFGDDIIEATHRIVNDNKYLILAGLSGDFKMKPIGHINELISFADKVDFLTAYCHFCDQCTDAPFTLKMGGTSSVVEVGAEIYKPVCREHYIEHSVDEII